MSAAKKTPNRRVRSLPPIAVRRHPVGPAAGAALPTPGHDGANGGRPASPGGSWRDFVGRWLEVSGSGIADAARGDWEVALSPALQKRWRRQRVRLVFDPLRPTLPRGAWFSAPGSSAGRKMLDAAREEPIVTRRTALAQVPGAPETGLASVCRVRGLTWGAPRLGPVHYERRVAFHAVVTLWGGLPVQEPWVVLLGPEGERLEWHRATGLPDVRSREGLYQITDSLEPEVCDRLAKTASAQIDGLLSEREQEWEQAVGRLRDDELARLSSFFAARVEEEEERSRRRTPHGDGPELESDGDATSLKLEWERRAGEVTQRWALRTEVRLWGLEEWAWPVAEIEQELRSGAVRVRLLSRVDVARGRPALPPCPSCGSPADTLIRARGGIACENCGSRHAPSGT
jgi:hypothetical protein